MSSAPSADEIWEDARWLAQAVDPRAGLVRLVEMKAEDYREASFLDDRMFDRPRTSHLLQWDEVANSMPSIRRADARWIFHIGHVGSTLIARLLGELKGILSVREPRALRDLTFFPAEVRAQYTPTLRNLFSRTFAPHQAALIKATSFVSEIAPELWTPRQPAIFVYASPRNYIAGILAGENSRKELAALAESRTARLASRGIQLPPARNEAELAAGAWACEMTALEAVGELTIGPRAWTDFDRMLEDPAKWLAILAGALRIPASDTELEAIANGPLMRRYSKATEHEYSPQLRRDLLAEAGTRHRSDIESALAMLDEAAETAPLLKQALWRASRSES